MFLIVGFIVWSGPAAVLIFLFFLLVRLRARSVVEEMQAVIYPAALPPTAAETPTSRGDEKTGSKDPTADKMETIESW